MLNIIIDSSLGIKMAALCKIPMYKQDTRASQCTSIVLLHKINWCFFHRNVSSKIKL